MADTDIPSLYEYPGTGPAEGAQFVVRAPDGKDYRLPAARLPTAVLQNLASLLVQGSGITITPNPDTGQLTIAAAGGGVGTPTTQLFAPTNLTATASGPDVAVSWTAAPNATGYQLQRALVSSGGVAGAFATVYRGTGNTFTDPGVPAGTYDYKVLSLGGGAYTNSPYSAAVRVMVAATPTPTKLPAPTGLAATPTSATVMGVSYNPVAHADGYRLQAALVNPDGTLGSWATIYTGSATSYTHAGRAASTTYAYQVLALGSGANLSSDYSDAVQATTPAGGGGTQPNSAFTYTFPFPLA